MQPGPAQPPSSQPPPQPYPQPYPPPYPPPAPKSNTAVIIVVVVVVVVLVAVLGLWAYITGQQAANLTPPIYVTVTAINLQISPAGTCWTSGTYSGTTVLAGTSIYDSWTFNYNAGLFQPNTCTIQSVSVSTAGFSLVSANTPLVVNDGGSQTLTVTVSTPSSAYTGVLALLLTVSSP